MAVNPKVRDLSVLLPLAGVLLLMSPVLQVFNSLTLIIGIPVIVLYIFGVWLGLIVLGAWLSRYQRDVPLPDPLPDPMQHGPRTSTALSPNTTAADPLDHLPDGESKDRQPKDRQSTDRDPSDRRSTGRS